MAQRRAPRQGRKIRTDPRGRGGIACRPCSADQGQHFIMASGPPQSLDEHRPVSKLQAGRGALRRGRTGVSIGGDNRVIQFPRRGDWSCGKSKSPISGRDFRQLQTLIGSMNAAKMTMIIVIA